MNPASGLSKSTVLENIFFDPSSTPFSVNLPIMYPSPVPSVVSVSPISPASVKFEILKLIGMFAVDAGKTWLSDGEVIVNAGSVVGSFIVKSVVIGDYTELT